ncbi:hypothetical protein CTI12_AA365680 [Artemisia annua]|uniref:Uncharacterized protein n=1 Tax=Artemisia annua TaxID=35608 RepID=A0A2U1MLZ4_ARTAN|nr:hypothetical protein CTI12_AA365680 [Artemisia annua]
MVEEHKIDLGIQNARESGIPISGDRDSKIFNGPVLSVSNNCQRLAEECCFLSMKFVGSRGKGGGKFEIQFKVQTYPVNQ